MLNWARIFEQQYVYGRSETATRRAAATVVVVMLIYNKPTWMIATTVSQQIKNHTHANEIGMATDSFNLDFLKADMAALDAALATRRWVYHATLSY